MVVYAKSKKEELNKINDLTGIKIKMDVDKIPGISKYDPLEDLLNEVEMGGAILECLMNNDPEGVMEMIQIYIEALHTKKKRLGEKVKLPKSTMYNSFKHKNPTIKTLAKLMQAYSHLKD